ncbi:peptide deformylase [Fulvivirgaceae bacterium BMA10]|uniref:Peptide deformylase n=1 Tax=Splendidivirga corallicola TaxID=3051826 RepID=A0ABT8KM90_9BACT|nr:peptide deformylase [Fulvivirgaceae bacterium BMA10]
MIYPIVAYGDPVLKKKAVDIEQGSINLEELVQDMFETMYNAQGVGLAAPQIGKSIRVFVVDGKPMDDDNMDNFKKVFVNPRILEEDGDDWPFEEGCLSIPDVRQEILRQPKLKIKYFDEQWNEYEEVYEGLKARIIQHEYDHIEGVLFTDHLSPFKKRLLKGKLANISKGNVKVEYAMRFPDKKGK